MLHRLVFATLPAMVIVNALLWILFGRYTAVGYWDFRRCSWDIPVGRRPD